MGKFQNDFVTVVDEKGNRVRIRRSSIACYADNVSGGTTINLINNINVFSVDTAHILDVDLGKKENENE